MMNDHLLPRQYRQSHRPSSFTSAYTSLARKLHALHEPLQQALPKISIASPIRVVCISDTHNSTPQVPPGDLLIHAGDLTQHGSFAELRDQIEWISSLPHTFKVVIAGNHDTLLDSIFEERNPIRVSDKLGESRSDLDWRDVIYLQDTCQVLKFPNSRELKIFGSPRTPEFGIWAFQYPPIRDVWTNAIPDDAAVVVVHGPPALYGDVDGKGDGYLLRELRRVMPILVVCGHIHDGYGKDILWHNKVNAANDEIILRCGGFMTILRMSFWVLVSWLRMLVGIPTSRFTSVVNAAIAPGANTRMSKAPIAFTV